MIIKYRDYDIKPHKDTPSHYIVVTSGKGGKIPDVLSGMFTSTAVAKLFVDNYLAGKPKKDTINDEEISKG